MEPTLMPQIELGERRDEHVLVQEWRAEQLQSIGLRHCSRSGSAASLTGTRSRLSSSEAARRSSRSRSSAERVAPRRRPQATRSPSPRTQRPAGRLRRPTHELEERNEQ